MKMPGPPSSFSSSLLLLLFLISLSLPSLFSCWDADGHQAIGMTAMSAIQTKSATQIKRLMGGKDVVDVAAWAHRVEVRYPLTSPLHFQKRIDKSNCEVLNMSDQSCPNNLCLVRAAQHFYGRLTGRPTLIPMVYPNNLQLTDSDALKFLINLIGDLHQPLHMGNADDDCGRNISIVFTDQTRAKKRISLYSYWNSELIQKFIHDRQSFWFGGWTHAHTLGHKLNILKSEWDTTPADTRHQLFEKWALESLRTACSSGYKNPHSQDVVVDGYEVPIDMEMEVFDHIKELILTAGARIAFILNSILAERDAMKLRQGSGVEVPIEEDRDAPLFGSLKNNQYLRSFGINLTIIVVVLGLFCYIGKFYASPISPSTSARVSVVSKNSEKRS